MKTKNHFYYQIVSNVYGYSVYSYESLQEAKDDLQRRSDRKDYSIFYTVETLCYDDNGRIYRIVKHSTLVNPE